MLRRTVLVLVVGIGLVPALTPAPVVAQDRDCSDFDAAAPAALEFVGLPGRVIIGKQEIFSLRRTHDTDAEPAGPYRVRMIDSTGHVFRRAELGDLDESVIIRFGLHDRGAATVEASYVEIDPLTGAQCERLIAREVRPKRWILFPSRCERGLQRRPRSVIVACGDGNLQLKRMRWRGWNRLRVRGRGLAWLNDCIPFCAEGTFHYVRARVTLRRPRRCANVERYVYTRLTYRYVRRPSWITWSGATVPFHCALFDLRF
jgi:hypothetical protein